ncbi:MAG: tRNA (N6-threonylcarbamoyladenosine(37)-N6)-methyltransferase TrmO [Deltaproteobacteria bacterium]|nr:tRNA (N6-threonylcarbamoyladenosine(37)-N6)-methyltransferase TrmO [Deltaproteobacteria bacterium]
MLDHEKWKRKAESSGLRGVAEQLENVIALSKEVNKHIEQAQRLLEKKKGSVVPEKSRKEKDRDGTAEKRIEQDRGEYRLKPIGVIRTPYVDSAPYQPLANDEGEFRLCVDPPYAEGLQDLDRFRYIYVLYLIHRVNRKPSMSVTPPWTPGKKVGLFSSRSPVRPNPLGLSIVEVKRVTGNEVFTSGLDAFDGTPLLDIKPYLKDLDSKDDANYGWLEDIDDREHLMLHIKGIPHDY